MAEVITDFFDQLKSRTKGYASMSFSEIGYRPNSLVRLDIRIHGEDAPPLATIVHRDRAHDRGKIVCNKLKELIPRQQFRVRKDCFICHFIILCVNKWDYYFYYNLIIVIYSNYYIDICVYILYYLLCNRYLFKHVSAQSPSPRRTFLRS